MDPARNEISGTVCGSSVQVHRVGGDVHVHPPADHERLIALYEELNLVRRQLAESVRAERDITQVAWMLAMVLSRLCDSTAAPVAEGVPVGRATAPVAVPLA